MNAAPPSPAASPTPVRWWPAAIALTVLAGLILLGALRLFTTFMAYDDEGYVLFSLREFAAGQPLYDAVYTQYGPFHPLLVKGLHALGLPLTNDGARVLTLGFWSAALCLLGLLVWRATRSLAAACATAVAAFLHLDMVASEPSHPGSFIVFAVAAAAAAATGHGSRAWRGVVLGMGVAGVTLTKINVGAFLIAGLLVVHLLGESGPGGRWRPWLATAGVAVLAWALLRRALSEPWCQLLFATVTLATAALALHADRRDSTRADTAGAVTGVPWRTLLVAAGATAALTLAVTLGFGTSPAALLEGVLLGPARHPTVYTAPFNWRPGSLIVAVLSFGAALAIARLAGERRSQALALGRLAVAVGYLLASTQRLGLSGASFTLSYGLALSWILVAPLRPQDPLHGVRLVLAALNVTQALHVFPVAGSQLAWGTFLFAPLLVLATMDALALLLPSPNLRRSATAALLAAGAMILVEYAAVVTQRWRNSVPLDLPGARHLRLPETLASSLRILSLNAHHQGEVLFTLPGLLSFHPWSERPAPTRANATHWFNLLTARQQEEIRTRLATAKSSTLIVQRYFVDLLRGEGRLERSALLRWLLEHYELRFKLESYEFWTPRTQPAIPLGLASLARGAEGTAARYRIDLVLPTATTSDLARVQLRVLGGDGSWPLTTWAPGTNAAFVRTRLAPPAGDGTDLTRVSVFTNDVPEAFRSGTALLHLQDDAGRKIGEARFSD